MDSPPWSGDVQVKRLNRKIQRLKQKHNLAVHSTAILRLAQWNTQCIFYMNILHEYADCDAAQITAQ